MPDRKVCISTDERGAQDIGLSSCKNLQRRKFLLYAITGITATIISGQFLLSNSRRQKDYAIIKSEHEAATPCKPKLKKGIISSKKGDLHHFEYRTGKNKVLISSCSVNEVGKNIIRHLNGQHTIEQISQLIVKGNKHPVVNTSCAEIAQFVAELGGLGFLTLPYYAQIYERYDS